MTMLRAIFRLANEWRDTVFYTVFIALVLSTFGDPGVTPINMIAAILVVTSLRESLRSALWYRSPIVIGAKRVNGERLGTDANFAAQVAIAVVLLLDHAILSLILAMVSMMIAAAMFSKLGGLSPVIDDYRDTMWDWPRKRDGGGQTKKLTDWINAMMSGTLAAAGAR